MESTASLTEMPGEADAIALDTLAKLASGASADVYLWEPSRVVKLFHHDFPVEAIAREARHARLANQLSFSTPALLGTISLNGRQGLIFERVEGRTAYELIVDRCRVLEKDDVPPADRNAPHMSELGRIFFNAQTALHQSRTRELEPLQAKLAERIRLGQRVPEALKREAVNALFAAPIVDTVCHGDFHPENLLLTSGGPEVIDWLDMSCGDPALDVARTLLYLTHGRADRVNARVRTEFVSGYLEACREAWFGHMERVLHWLRPVVIARLSLGSVGEDERGRLFQLLEAPDSWLPAP